MTALNDPIDLQLLVTLVAIADTGSFAAAANRIGRTQSAVSMQVKRLEDLVGKPPLFKRGGRRMLMTPRGEALLAHARRLLDLHVETRAMLAKTSGIGSVRLGVPEDYVGSLLPWALDRFAHFYPNVQVEVVCEPSGSLSQLIVERKIHLAVVTCGAELPNVQLLRHEPIVWVTSPHHAVHQEDTVPLALFQPGCFGRRLTLDAWAKCGRPYRIAYSSPSVSGLLTIVKAGLAVASLARCSVPEGFRILGPEEGFPVLPLLSIALLQAAVTEAEPAVLALAEKIRTAFAGDRLPPAHVKLDAQ